MFINDACMHCVVILRLVVLKSIEVPTEIILNVSFEETE